MNRTASSALKARASSSASLMIDLAPASPARGGTRRPPDAGPGDRATFIRSMRQCSAASEISGSSSATCAATPSASASANAAQLGRQRLVVVGDLRSRTLPHVAERQRGRPPTDRASAARLHGRGARSVPAGACRLPAAHGRSCRAALRRAARSSVAISTAAAAASRPLLSGVRPRPHLGLLVGQRRQHAERHRHAGGQRPPRQCRACAASAMYSKCIVSPLIRQPRQMTASKRPLSASRCAAIGISNAPGHAHDRDVVVADVGLGERARARQPAARR